MSSRRRAGQGPSAAATDERYRPAGAVPAGQWATEASLRARLAAALDRNKRLADENTRLRRQLAHALGVARHSP